MRWYVSDRDGLLPVVGDDKRRCSDRDGSARPWSPAAEVVPVLGAGRHSLCPGDAHVTGQVARCPQKKQWRGPPWKELEDKDKCMEKELKIQDFSTCTLGVNTSVYGLVRSSQRT